jgi:pimeloyl-ACP methyl ester carboxylesterase
VERIESNGKEIGYTTGRGGIQKDRITLVFVHGSGGSHLHWNFQRRFFQESHNVVLVDLPGHGTVGGGGEDSVRAYAEHLFHLVRTLPHSTTCLVGHSLGGAIVQTFALLYPDHVEALGLVGTGARLRVLPEILTGLEHRFEQTVRMIAHHAFSREASPQLIQRGVEVMLNTPPAVLLGDFAACDRFDIMERLGEVRIPTLVICGSDDRLTPPKYSRYLAERIQNARLELIEGAGHMVMMEQPQQFNRRAMAFLKTLGGLQET